MTTTARPRLRRRAAGVATASIAVLMVLSACGSSGTGTGGLYGAPPPSSPTPPTQSPTPTPTQSAGSGQAVRADTTAAGAALVNANGMTLYVFAADSPGHSTCTASCARYWPPAPATAASLTHPADVTAKLGVVTRTDGTNQLTLNGWPAYTYTGDSAAGQANGQGLNTSGGLWWVVSPTGAWIKTASGASSSGGGYVH